jgi:hypothetical protein
MKYQIMTKSWSKRRPIDTSDKVQTIEFIDFKKQHDHFCKMLIQYKNGTQETLISRVVFNQIKNHWTVDGMKVAVRLIDLS